MKNIFFKILFFYISLFSLGFQAFSAECTSSWIEVFEQSNLRKSDALFSQILANIHFEKRNILTQVSSGSNTNEKEDVLRETIHEFEIEGIFPDVADATDPLFEADKIRKDILENFYEKSQLDDETIFIDFVAALFRKLNLGNIWTE